MTTPEPPPCRRRPRRSPAPRPWPWPSRRSAAASAWSTAGSALGRGRRSPPQARQDARERMRAHFTTLASARSRWSPTSRSSPKSTRIVSRRTPVRSRSIGLGGSLPVTAASKQHPVVAADHQPHAPQRAHAVVDPRQGHEAAVAVGQPVDQLGAARQGQSAGIGLFPQLHRLLLTAVVLARGEELGDRLRHAGGELVRELDRLGLQIGEMDDLALREVDAGDSPRAGPTVRGR